MPGRIGHTIQNTKLADDVKEKQFLHHIKNGQDLVGVNAGAVVTDLLVGSGPILAVLQCHRVECSLGRFADFGVNGDGDGVDVG